MLLFYVQKQNSIILTQHRDINVFLIVSGRENRKEQSKMDDPKTKAINVYIFLPKTTSLLVMISIDYSAVI